MEIMKSKYTSTQLKEVYEGMEAKVDYKAMDKIHLLHTISIGWPYPFWALCLIYGFLTNKDIFIFASLLFSIVGLVLSRLKKFILFLFVSHFVDKGYCFYNVLDKTPYRIWYDALFQCEDLIKQGVLDGDYTLLNKGEERILLVKGKKGEEKIFPLLAFVTENRVLDYSVYDKEIENLIEDFRSGKLNDICKDVEVRIHKAL